MEDSAEEGATEFHDYEGGGIGEGEGMKDVSDQIENEEQVRFHMPEICIQFTSLFPFYLGFKLNVNDLQTAICEALRILELGSCMQ